VQHPLAQIYEKRKVVANESVTVVRNTLGKEEVSHNVVKG
jgi:hypothetical protein